MAAWQQALVLSRMIGHLLYTNEAAQRRFLESYKRTLFLELGTSVGQTAWRTYRNIMRVTLWGRDHFRNKVRLAMAAEALGLGPQFYCVMQMSNRGFFERLFLLLQFLPHQKIYLHPHFGLRLSGPFNRSLYASQVGVAISQRVIPMDERPNTCPICDTCFCDHAMDRLVEL